MTAVACRSGVHVGARFLGVSRCNFLRQERGLRANSSGTGPHLPGPLVAAAVAVTGYALYRHYGDERASVMAATAQPGTCLRGAKSYTSEEIRKHVTPDTGVWVTYKCGVYDVTKYMDSHLGGRKKIMGTAGGDIAPCFDHIPVHRKDKAQQDLERLRIGNVEEMLHTDGH
ncbi:uncharacterized protein LOC128235335 isoform X1 [Mya arenaria]|nr:uncharacterized protein LOC128235335 isoform X1 [Mya arenaria]